MSEVLDSLLAKRSPSRARTRSGVASSGRGAGWPTQGGRGVLAVESTEGVSQKLPGREFLRWAPSRFGVTISFTYELGVYPGLARDPPSALCILDRRGIRTSTSKAFALTWYRALCWYFLRLSSPRTHFKPWKAVGTRERGSLAAR